jgi:DNA-binding transcriptional MerR regulator
MMKEHSSMIYIGQVAKLTGASRRAIRLYEEMGLIPLPKRRGKYRIYDETTIKAISLIKYAQEAGFTLAELRSFINIKVRENRFPIEHAGELIERKRQALNREIEHLEQHQRRLNALEAEINRRYANQVDVD